MMSLNVEGEIKDALIRYVHVMYRGLATMFSSCSRPTSSQRVLGMLTPGLKSRIGRGRVYLLGEGNSATPM